MSLSFCCLCVLLCFSSLKVFVHATETTASLRIRSGDQLNIDTTKLTAQKRSESSLINLKRGNANCSETQKNSSEVAELTVTNDIILEKDSTIVITGHRALSMESVQGNIKIDTDVRMTCAAAAVGHDTCLGGYTQTNTTYTLLYTVIHPGKGPGWKGDVSKAVPNNDHCFPGGSHGGKGGGSSVVNKELKRIAYNTKDYRCMHGGSAGFSKERNACISGGAVEIKAKQGMISIGGSISASAFVTDSSKAFAGCSGGLIRLVAKKVQMLKGSSLNVSGASAGSNLIGDAVGGKGGNGGGGGGVIQIIASSVDIRNISLAGGKPRNCSGITEEHAEAGILTIKSNETNTIEECKNNSSMLHYKWQSPNFVFTQDSEQKNGSLVDLNLVSATLVQLKDELKEGISLADIDKLMLSLEQLKNISAGNLTKDELLQIVGIFKNCNEILDLLSKQITLSKVQDIFSEILDISTLLIAAKNFPNWKTIRQLPNLVDTLERMALSATNTSNSSSVYRFNTKAIAIHSHGLPSNQDGLYRFPVIEKLVPNSFVTAKDYILIQKSALQKNVEEYRMVVVFFKDIQQGLPELNSTDQIQGSKSEPFQVSSMLVSYTLYHFGEPVKKLLTPASLNFRLVTDKENTKNKRAQARCVYWNLNDNSWASDGVSVEDFNSSRANCTTTHFTSFAVLMQHTPIPLTKAEELSLLLITYVGCGISTAALLISLIVFVSIEALSSDRHRIHLNLVIALLLAQILFLSGITATSHEMLCKVIAGALHYFYLVSFTWMLIEGVHLYLKVVKVFGIENVKLMHYCILGWGAPALIVGAAAVIKPYGFGTKYVCWLSMEDGFVWAFIGPVIGIIAINCFILVAVIKTVVASASTMKSSDHSHIKAGIKGALVLMPLMGITWIFGLLAVNRNSLVFQYIFSIANSLQGTLIFFLHIVFNNEVRQAFKRQRERKQLSKESGDYNASVSNSNESGGKVWGTSSTSKSLTGRIKARLSMSKLPRTSRVVNVQPLKSDKDEDVQINRKFYHDHTNLAPELSTSLNSPSGIESDSKPPMHSPLKSAKRNTDHRL